MAQTEVDLIEIGHILGAHGIKGQVKVFSNTSPRKNIVTYSPWIIEQQGLKKTVDVSGAAQGKNIVAMIEGICDRDQAQALSGAKIFIKRSQLPQLSEGEFYWSQLIGLQVTTTDNIELGIIDYMMETGANDVMVVKGDRERLIPYIMDDVIKSIDLQNKLITVDWDADF